MSELGRPGDAIGNIRVDETGVVQIKLRDDEWYDWSSVQEFLHFHMKNTDLRTESMLEALTELDVKVTALGAPPVEPAPIPQPPAPVTNPYGLTLVYDEQFAEGSRLGTDFYFRPATEMVRGAEQQIWDTRLAWIENGQLHLKSERRSDGRWYGAEANWNRQFNPGYTEYRFWTPTRKYNWWHGGWLVRPSAAEGYRPEIDITEDPGLEDNVVGYLTVHLHGFDSPNYPLRVARNAWHVAGCRWGPGICEVKIDGVKVAEIPPGTPALAQLTKPLIFVAQANVLKPNVWGTGPDGSWNSAEWILDYVRHYE